MSDFVFTEWQRGVVFGFGGAWVLATLGLWFRSVRGSGR